MKRFIILCSLLLAGISLPAKVVSVDRARSKAAAFFAKSMPRTKAMMTADAFRLIGTFPETGTKSMVQPAMYIFGMDGGGYVIVSADDVARPVLGWSLDEDFPYADMPDNMRALLDWYAEIIDYARAQGWVDTADSSGEIWDEANSVVLNTAPWSQSSPFNDLVPEVDGSKPPIGCVATAVSIIMRYHQWPNKGTGSLPAYDYILKNNSGIYHVDGVELGHEYDWSKMPLKANGFSEEESAQIARLLYDVAVMCETLFGPGNSTSTPSSAKNGLPVYFDYDKEIRYYERDRGYTDNQWESFVKQEIDANRPVLYGGSRNNGHAFVIDGYNGRFFHINYGWGGATTEREGHDERLGAFYTLTPVQGHEADLLVYYQRQQLVSHIMPNHDGRPVANLSCTTSGDATGIPWGVSYGKGFRSSFHLTNGGFGSSTVETALALCGSDGGIKQLASDPVTIEIGNYYNSLAFNANLSGPLNEGDELIVMFKYPGEQNWSPVTMGRNIKNIFTKRPLSALVEIGYLENPLTGKGNDLPSPPHFYMKIYKDLIWGIYTAKKRDDVLFCSTRDVYMYPSVSQNKTISGEMVFQTVLLGEDGETEHFEFSLPPGDYVLYLENPATEEKKEVNLKF